MARSVRAGVESRSARLRLRPGKQPYYTALEKGLAIGYHRPIGGGAGTWWGRVRIDGRYVVASLGTADDHTDADGVRTLSWRQAQEVTRSWARRRISAGPLTVADAAQLYLDDLRARRGERPAHEARLTFNRYLMPTLGAVRLIDLTDVAFRTWRNALVIESGDPERARRSRATANRVIVVARAALNFAHGAGLIADDQAWRLVRPFRGTNRARMGILDDTQLQRLIEACGPGLRELVALGAWTGARWGELANARRDAFDAAAGTLEVDGKTGRRVVFLPPDAIRMLQRSAAGKRHNDYLLTRTDGKRWTEGSHSWPFLAAVRKAGLPSGTVYYSLRHSFISRALRQLVPIKAIADACGASMRQIEETYGKFLVTDRRHYAAIAAPELRLDAEVVPLRAAR